MKTLNCYVGRQLLGTTLIAIGVLTFVMLSANLFKAFELLARGVPLLVLLQFLLYLMPDILTFTAPLALLCSCVLVFSRLSADNEITAMRASGISLWQIVSPGLLISVVLSVVCMLLHTTISPRCRHRAYLLRRTEGIKNPLVVIEPGRFVELPGYVIRVGERSGNALEDVHIFALGSDGKVRQDITARRGTVRVNDAARMLEIELEEATIAAVDLSSENAGKRLRRFATQSFTFPLDYGAEVDRRPLTRKLKYMDLGMLFGRIYIDSAMGLNTTATYVELHTRLSMALSPFAFLLLGIPFGVRTQRSETSVGLLVCLCLALGFYAFIMLADGLKYQAALHPEILVWLPNIIYQIGGLWALSAMARR